MSNQIIAGGRAKPRQQPGPASEGAADDGDTQIVLALARGLDVLGAFRRTDAGLGNAELAERTGMTKPTVSRLAYTLAKQGYLHFDMRARIYRLGVKAVALGAIAQATTSVRLLAMPLMRELAHGSRFNVGLGTRDMHQMVYVDTCEGDALVSVRLFPGSRIPLNTSAMGRAYIASLSDVDRAALLTELEVRHGSDWAKAAQGVEQACSDLATHGFCVSLGDWQPDIHGVAVPIRPIPGQASYVLNLGGPAYALTKQDIRKVHGPRLVALVAALETSLGLDQVTI